MTVHRRGCAEATVWEGEGVREREWEGLLPIPRLPSLIITWAEATSHPTMTLCKAIIADATAGANEAAHPWYHDTFG